MAFFKFRWPGPKRQDGQSTPTPSRSQRTESIDVMRRRARHRLIGAGVLVLLGVIGFPMLFDTQPRPIPVDIPIEIPDRNRVAPLVVPDSAPAPVAAAPGSRAAAAASLADGEEVLDTPAARKPPAAAAAPAKPEVRPEPKPEAKPEPKPEPKPAPKPEPKPEPKPAPKPEPRPEAPKPAPHNDEAARARALLEGRAPPPPAPSAAAAAQEGRFIVQIGAFADADKAREARQKLERAGLKTYTQVVDTKDGKRTRVRVGPLANRAEAEKAAARIRGLDLPASILTL